MKKWLLGIGYAVGGILTALAIGKGAKDAIKEMAPAGRTWRERIGKAWQAAKNWQPIGQTTNAVSSVKGAVVTKFKSRDKTDGETRAQAQ